MMRETNAYRVIFRVDHGGRVGISRFDNLSTVSPIAPFAMNTSASYIEYVFRIPPGVYKLTVIKIRDGTPESSFKYVPSTLDNWQTIEESEIEKYLKGDTIKDEPSAELKKDTKKISDGDSGATIRG